MLKSFGLTGHSENKIDIKGRINIPSQMRKILAPDDHDEVVISLGRGGQLSLFNKDYWVGTIQQNIMDQADTVKNPKDWDAIQRKIHILSENSHMSAVDSQGRITIPQWLLKKAGIMKQAHVIGAVDRVNVWEPDRYKSWKKQEDADSDIESIYI